MSELVKAELLATCNSLGYEDGDTYYKDQDCLASLTDLIRFLKHDDSSHEIRRQLGKMKIMQSDLINLLNSLTKSDKQILNILIRLMVDLTMPALIVFDEDVPADVGGRKTYLESISHLQGYKLAFCQENVWKTLSNLLRDYLSLEWEKKLEEDSLFVERLLVLVRNILHIPANPAEEMRTDDDVSVHDRILWELHKSGLDDLILFLVNSDDYQEFCLHSLEIISLMLKEQDSSTLATSGNVRSLTEKMKDLQELEEARKKEIQQKTLKLFKDSGTRFPRSSGTFCVKNMKSISDQDLIIYKPISDIKSIDFDRNKNAVRKSKNKQPIEDTNVSRRSTLSIRLFLRDLCTEFLSSAYNSIMSIVKDQINRTKDKDHDESYYLWIMRFFMEFNRCGNFKVDLVSETLSIQTFHYIQTQMETYLEMMKLDKAKCLLWSKRLHLAFKAYKELVMNLQAMDTATEESVRSSANVIKSNLFYMIEYRDLPADLLLRYNEVTMPKTYLKDLIETTHVFIKMMEKHVKVYSNLVIQKKSRKTGKKKKTKKPIKKANPNEKETKSLESIWEIVAKDLKMYLNGDKELPDGILPFDAASEIPIDEQKETAIRRIKGYLHGEKGPQALALLRSSREVWPDGDLFGASVTDDDAELETLKEILMTSLPGGGLTEPAVEKDTEVGGSGATDGETRNNEETEPKDTEYAEDEDSAEDEEIEEIKEMGSGRREGQMDLKAFVMRFANPKVLKAYGLLLRNFEINTDFTNHCVVKMFHRIAWDCKMLALFFQLSFFRDFQKIMESPTDRSSLKELQKFAKFILRKFFEVPAKNDLIFVEILFWKNPAAAYECVEGYNSYQNKQSSGARWTEEKNEELKSLYNEYKDKIEPGVDIVDVIFDNLNDTSKTRRQILGQLKRLELLDKSHSFKKKVQPRGLGDWTEEEVSQMKQLYERFQLTDDVVARIVDNLSIRRPKARVITKLVEIGVISDKSQVRKKFNRPINKKSSRPNTPASADEVDVPEKTVNDAPEKLEYVLLHAGAKKELLGSIKWVADDLKDIANDRETGADKESVPLVPIMQENHEALENPIFIRLLKALGLQPPQIGQETYWRYPAKLSAGICRKRGLMLQECFEENDGDGLDMASQSDDSDGSEDYAINSDANNLIANNSMANNISSQIDSDNDVFRQTEIENVEEKFNEVSSPVNHGKRKVQILSDDDEEESKNEIENINENLNEESSPVKHGKRKIQVLSDDDDDGEEGEKSLPKKSKKTFVIDSDSE